MEIVNQTGYHIAWIAGKKEHPADSLTLCVKASFQLQPGGVAIPAETQMLNGDVYVDDDLYKGLIYDSDFAYFKQNADLLLSGSCYTPGGQPLPKCDVSFSVAGMQKTLKVFGPRYADPGLLGDSASSAEPFTTMPLSFENTYGGTGYKKNPSGKGRDKDENGITWWPNVVDPNLGDKEPAGFGPINRSWSQRTDKLGSYGGDYMEKRWPWFPEDFDWDYFNAAAEDMQYSGYLVGDESLYFENLHPSISEYRSQLPGVKPRCFLQEHEGGEAFREVEMNLDTIYVDMDAEQVSLVWRGVAEIKSHDFRELSHVFLVSESLDETAAASNYEEQFLAAITPVAIVADEPEPAEPVVEAEPEVIEPEPETASDTGDEDLNELADEFKAAFAKAGLDPAIIDDIVNETIPPSVIILNLMAEAGLSEEEGKKALVEIQDKQVDSLQELGLSAEEIEILMDDQ